VFPAVRNERQSDYRSEGQSRAGRNRAQLRAIFDKLTLNNLDKHIATLFLKLDVVDETVRDRLPASRGQILVVAF
jgi:hypothetical protein